MIDLRVEIVQKQRRLQVRLVHDQAILVYYDDALIETRFAVAHERQLTGNTGAVNACFPIIWKKNSISDYFVAGDKIEEIERHRTASMQPG